jgi:Bacterial regulatory proteins, tetR family
VPVRERVASRKRAGGSRPLGDRGWEQFGIAEVASRAGVHETSIYRRRGTRERLATEELLAIGAQDLPVPDTGSLRGDLAGFAAGICQYMSTPLGLTLARALATPTGDRQSPRPAPGTSRPGSR